MARRVIRRRQWLPSRKWRVVGRVDEADEIPDRLPRRGAILVGTEAPFKWMAFNCPCGASHRIMLNLDPGREPAWRVVGEAPLSLAPSIDSLDGHRRCHFFIRSGRIHWV